MKRRPFGRTGLDTRAVGGAPRLAAGERRART